MLTRRPAAERGYAHHGWLESWHTFSFADYVDPVHVHFSVLRVINDDRIAPEAGFGTHPHRDMEIITCLLSGALEHRDSMGNGSVIRAGDVQRMTAGTGITHSEFNPSSDEPTHLLQIWILPERKNLVPEYEQKAFPREQRRGRWCTVASPDGRDGSLTIHQDVTLALTALEAGETLLLQLAPGRCAWIQVAEGEVEVDGMVLATGDGLKVVQQTEALLRARTRVDLLFFDLP